MSSGRGAAGGGGVRVLIPSNVRKMIQNIKEITGSHSEEDIYSMLKECSMDPNETAQKLLLQDTFHEVKRKRNRKKENLNKEPAESSWKAGMQRRGNRGSRGTFSSSNISHDNIAGGRSTTSAMENGPNQVLEKSIGVFSSPISLETKSKEANSAASSLAAIASVPAAVISGNLIVMQDRHAPAYSGTRKLEEHLAPSGGKNPATASEIRHQYTEQTPESSDCSTSMTSAQPSGAYFLSSDPVLSSSRGSGSVLGTMKYELGIDRTSVETSAISDKIIATTGASESGSSNVQGMMPSKAQEKGKNQHLDTSQTIASVHTGSAVSRPSSNYNNRLQVIGPQKVGPNMEWKPKSTIANRTQGSGIASSSEASAVSDEVKTKMPPAVKALESEEADVNLQRKLEELHVYDGQHVVIPNHLHVPDAEKLGFRFGSFDASFGIGTICISTPENDQSASLSEISDINDEAAEEQCSSNENALVPLDVVDYPKNNQLSSYAPENLSSEGGVPSSNAPEYDESKQETTSRSHQHSVAHTSPNHSFGFMSPILGSQLAPIESSKNQPRDVSLLPTFVVQQPFDPTNCYAQFYRSGADSEGRISSFHYAGVATKYSGNFPLLSPQTLQSTQESSMAVTQQPLPVFRPPAGMHLPHYPSNYIPYGHYVSPFYIPPSMVHQFLSNGAFPQQPQPQGSNVYPGPLLAAAKHSLPQYKLGTNTNNSSHVGIPGSYVPCGSAMANYYPSTATAAGNLPSNEDLATSHFKDSNVHASSLQGQMAFTPSQPGHGTFAGIYHPAQPVNATIIHPLLQQCQAMASPVNMVGPTGSVYQHSQINWPSNF